ncbi:MAG: helix-turn-helix domain-containing protein [bacterium]|jgi:transcriptional regulator with XRE-family HTH domain
MEKIFGQVLKELRSGNNLSQEKLSEITGLDRTYISMLERGIRQPSLSTLSQIADAFKIKTSELIKMLEIKIDNEASI